MILMISVRFTPLLLDQWGLDPAYGSSAFGIVVTQWVDGIVQILCAEEYHRPDYNEMLYTVYSLMSKYGIDMVYVDGANPSFIKSLKLQIDLICLIKWPNAVYIRSILKILLPILILIAYPSTNFDRAYKEMANSTKLRYLIVHLKSL
jgi:hypothetical protein